MCGCVDRELWAETTDKPNLVQSGQPRPTPEFSCLGAGLELSRSRSVARPRQLQRSGGQWRTIRDREPGQSARDGRDRQAAGDTLAASGGVVGYVRCSDRDGTEDDGRAERDRSWKL